MCPGGASRWHLWHLARSAWGWNVIEVMTHSNVALTVTAAGTLLLTLGDRLRFSIEFKNCVKIYMRTKPLSKKTAWNPREITNLVKIFLPHLPEIIKAFGFLIFFVVGGVFVFLHPSDLSVIFFCWMARCMMEYLRN